MDAESVAAADGRRPQDYVSATVVTIVLMLALDAVWLGWLMRGKWSEHITGIQGGQDVKFRYAPAALTYAVMVASVVGAVVTRVRREHLVRDSLLWGAAAGFMMYAVFNGTNLAMFKDYRWDMAAVDTTWGTAMVAVVSLAASAASYHWLWTVKK